MIFLNSCYESINLKIYQYWLIYDFFALIDKKVATLLKFTIK